MHADPRPLPAGVTRELLAAIETPAPGLRLCLAASNIEDIPDGWYTVHPGDRSGPAMAEVQGAFRYPPSDIAVAGMNLALVITAEVAPAAAGRRRHRPAPAHRGGRARDVLPPGAQRRRVHSGGMPRGPAGT